MKQSILLISFCLILFSCLDPGGLTQYYIVNLTNSDIEVFYLEQFDDVEKSVIIRPSDKVLIHGVSMLGGASTLPSIAFESLYVEKQDMLYLDQSVINDSLWIRSIISQSLMYMEYEYTLIVE